MIQVKHIKVKKSHIITNIVIYFLLAIVVIENKDFFKEAIKVLVSTNPILLLTVMVFALLYYVTDGYIWYRICHNDQPSLKLNRCLEIEFITAFFNLLTFGTGGTFAKIFCFYRQDIEIGKVTAVWLIQCLFYKIVVMVFGLLAIMFSPHILYNTAINSKIVIFGCILSILIAVFLIVFALNRRLVKFSEKKIKAIQFKNEKIISKINETYEQIEVFQNEFLVMLKDRVFCLKIFLLNSFMIASYMLIPAIMIASNSIVNLTDAFHAMSLTTLLSGVIPSPSGFGAVEVIYYALLRNYHVSLALAGALIMLRLLTVFIPFGIGGILWLKTNKHYLQK